MTEIDALEGAELARAVAEAIGLTQDASHPRWWDDEDGYGLCIDDIAPTYRDGKLISYRPDLYIAQAWELVDVLWEDRKDFDISREDDDLWWLSIHDLRWCNEETNSYKILVSEMMRGTAPEVICRAFLKAKAVEA